MGLKDFPKFIFIILIGLSLQSCPLYANEENIRIELIASNSSVIGTEFSVYPRLINPTNQTLYNPTIKRKYSDALVCHDNPKVNETGQITVSTITIGPEKSAYGNWTCVGRKVGEHAFTIEANFNDSKNKTHSANLSKFIQILQCEYNNCTLPLWTVGKFNCIEEGAIYQPEGALLYRIPLIIYKKPDISYRDLTLNINSFTIEVPSNNTLKINYDFYIKPGKRYRGDKKLDEIIFLYYTKGEVKNIKINNINANIRDKGLLRIGAFDSEYFNCMGSFYEPQLISYIDIQGGVIAHPLEINKNYVLTMEVEDAFKRIDRSSVSEFGIFMPLGDTVLDDASVVLNEDFDGFISLKAWKENRNITNINSEITGLLISEEGNVGYEINNTLVKFFDFSKTGNKFKLDSEKVGTLIITGYTLLEYGIQIWEKPSVTTPTETLQYSSQEPPKLDKTLGIIADFVTIVVGIIAIAGTIHLIYKNRRKLKEIIRRGKVGTSPLILGSEEALISSIEDFLLRIETQTKSPPIRQKKIRGHVEDFMNFLIRAKVREDFKDKTKSLIINCQNIFNKPGGMDTTQELLDDTQKLEEEARKLLEELKSSVSAHLS